MTLFIVGLVLLVAGIGIIFYVRSPDDDQMERTHVYSAQHVILSNVVLAMIVGGGALMALAVF